MNNSASKTVKATKPIVETQESIIKQLNEAELILVSKSSTF